ncbi:MAG TPA: CDP-diacylglycerol diphosphatase [Stellaceae bacterium]|nr:CDP-diacylglycerol diphosphatase [Stellaceae bacterium]
MLRRRTGTLGRFCCGASLLFGLVLLPIAAPRAADPSALWHIVHDRCVPDEEQHHDPAPCALVDLAAGEARGYVVLKDLVGAEQFLVLPVARITGIESPALLAPDAPNYLQDAWSARRFVAARAPRRLAREDISLAVNSAFGRTQNQLHVHVDCVSAGIREALARHRAELGDDWKPFPEILAGHAYLARRLRSPALAGVNPFLLLAAGVPGARQDMGAYTLFLAGESFGGKPGFVLLADRADPAHGDFASSESLQDHACAAR